MSAMILPSFVARTAPASACWQARPTVCQLLHGLRVGGTEVLAARLARRLNESFRFIFVCLDELGTLGAELRQEGFGVHVLERRPGLDWRCVWRLARILWREQVDVIHAHQYTPFFYGAIARLAVRRPGVLFTEHGRHFPDYPRRKRIWANRLLLRRRDRVVGVGQAVRQALIANEGLSPERVGVVYNGVDLEHYARREQERAAARQELGLASSDYAILQVARLDYLKDHATAVRTMARVVHAEPNARLLVVGEGPELPMIEGAIRQHSLEGNIKLLGLRADVPRLLAAADVFLLTSISEGIPVTLIEAMAAKLPVVSTAVGGVAEVVRDDETGLLAPSGNDAALAASLLRLRKHPELAKRFGSAGRARAERIFSEPANHKHYRGLYEELIRA